jgi:hypothetical protein
VDAPPQEAADPLNPTVVTLPAGSKIQFVATPEGCTLMVPPVGFGGSRGGMLVFGMVWLGMVSVISGAMIFGKAAAHNQQPGWMGGLFLVPFWAIGIGMLCGAIQMARRRAVLVANADVIAFTQKGPIRSTEKQWPRGEIAAIRVEFSGVEENHRPLMQVQLRNASGKKLAGLFTGRPVEELEYVAAQLRQALNVPAS